MKIHEIVISAIEENVDPARRVQECYLEKDSRITLNEAKQIIENDKIKNPHLYLGITRRIK